MARTKKIETKFCPACGEEHPVTAFGNDKTSKDGRYRVCLEADRAQQRAWRQKRKEQLEEAKRVIEEKKVARTAKARTRRQVKRAPKATAA